MTNSQSQLTHIPDDWKKIETPFEGDVLGREKLAIKMTDYLSRLKAGAVLAIDAPWGEGKSWFGRHWSAHLNKSEQNYRVVYIDAFEQDYVEDPFVLIATELAQLIEDEKTLFDSFSQASYNVIKTLTNFSVPLIPYLIAMIDPSYLLAIAPVAAVKLKELVSDDEIKALTDKAQEKSIEVTNEWIKQKFEAHKEEKNSVVTFRDQLTEIAKEKQIVIFIDELDRCRPDFAVKILERIKHFFNVENVIFVLLLNREQLQNAVKGIYGEKTDAATYLGKFVNFFFTLPKIDDNNQHTYTYIQKEAEKYQIQNHHFIDTLTPLAIFFKLSLRDIEKAVAMYVFSGEYKPNNIYYLYVLYAICLKIKEPELYVGIISNDIETHQILANKLWFGHLASNKSWSELGALSEWHKYVAAKLKRTQIAHEKLSDTHPLLANSINPAAYNLLMGMFSKSASKIDLSID